jgi:hypothetical protein
MCVKREMNSELVIGPEADLEGGGEEIELDER